MTKNMIGQKEYQNEQGASSKATLCSLALALLLPTMSVSITNVALPTLAYTFKASISSVNWIVTAYLLSVTSFIIGAGILGHIFGRKCLLLLGIVIFSFASLMCALSLNLWMLIIGRLIQGLGAAFILSQSLILVSSALPKNQLGTAMGLMNTTAAIGTALGPILGGTLIDTLGWQSIFWVLFLFGVIGFIFCKKFIISDLSKNYREFKQFDFLGTILLALSCLLFSISINSVNKVAAVSSLLLLLSAMVVLLIFLMSQRKCQYPLFDLTFFTHKLRNATLASSFFVEAVAMSTLVIGAYYLTYALKLSPVAVGGLMSIGPLLSACSGYTSGKLVDKIGIKKVMLLGLSQIAVGMLCFAYLPVYFGVLGYISALFVLTPGRQLFLAANNTYVMQSATEKEKGFSSGIINLTKNLGLMTGASLIAGIFALQLKNEDIEQVTQQQIESAFTNTFILASTVICISIITIYRFSYQMTELK